jgi:endonuclease G
MLSYVITAMLVIHVPSGNVEDTYCSLSPSSTPEAPLSEPHCFKHFKIQYSGLNHLPLQTTYTLNPDVKGDAYPFNDAIKSKKITPGFDREKAAHVAGYDFAPLANNFILNTTKKHRNSEINREGGMWHWLLRYELSMPIKVGKLHAISGVVTTKQDYIPKAFYKVLYQQDINMAIAYLIPNTKEAIQDKHHYITSIGCIEKAIGYPLVSTGSLLPKSLRWAVAYSPDVWADGANTSKHCPDFID